MAVVFDINIDKAIELTVKLGKLHRSALPVAVRGTLNDMAFETKKFIPKTAKRKFITRNKAFFKAFTGVEIARGFNINNMEAVVGVLPNKRGKGSKIAAGLEEQETGGAIKGRKLIPHNLGRVLGSRRKKLQPKNRFEKLSYLKGKPSVKRGRKSNIVAQAIVAAKTGKLMLIRKGGKGTYFRVKSVTFGSGGSNRGVSFNMTPIFVKRNSRISRVKPSPFMKPASFIAIKKIDEFYKKQAERQFKRLLK